MSSDMEVVAMMPPYLKVHFPCVLTPKSGLDVQLARIIRPLVDKGSTFEAISCLLRELHSLSYFDEMLQHQSEQLSGRVVYGLFLLRLETRRIQKPTENSLTTMHGQKQEISWRKLTVATTRVLLVSISTLTRWMGRVM